MQSQELSVAADVGLRFTHEIRPVVALSQFFPNNYRGIFYPQQWREKLEDGEGAKTEVQRTLCNYFHSVLSCGQRRQAEIQGTNINGFARYRHQS